jgi:hypothetical protein
MSQEYHQVHPQDVQNNLDLFAILIDKALTKNDYAEYSVRGCCEKIINNEWQLFVILKDGELEYIIVTLVAPHELCCDLIPVIIAKVNNKKVDLNYMHKCLEEIAVKFKCNRIVGGGRKGWKKVFNKFGYKDLNLVVKEL